MKLYSSILEKYIDLPTKDSHELRMLLDDVGLEVKDIEQGGGGVVYNIETLANRGDHLSAQGIARELSARLLVQTKHPNSVDLPDRKSSVIIRKETESCMRYALLEMNISPDLKLRGDIIAVLGQESESKRHPIVDILNYCALEMGQPMHAFDKEKIDGEIIIDVTTSPEEIEALDGKRYKVPTNSIVIKDRKKIVAVAGVIGCANSMVTSGTNRVLIESASFDPILVRKTARAMGISTDASYAFERGCDVEQVIPALRRVIALAEGPGDLSGQAIGVSYVEGSPVEKRKVTVRLPWLKAQLNLPRLADIEIITRLKNLGYGVEAKEGSKELVVSVPSWRLWDVSNEDDIIEDFVKSHGLSTVKIELPPLDPDVPPLNPMERVFQQIESSLLGNGFYEVISRSFYSREDYDFLTSLDSGLSSKHVSLKNSIESNYAFLKTTNVLHFARIAAQNFRMGVQGVKIFEFGRLFDRTVGESEFERDALCLAASGRWYDNEWQKAPSKQELFMLFKGAVSSVMASLGRDVHVSESKNPLLHPGFQCSVIAGRETLGIYGLIHPKIAQYTDLRQDLVYGEFSGEKLAREIEGAVFSEPSDFPSIRRDITLKVPMQFFCEKIRTAIGGGKVNNLIDLKIVDDFRKESEDFRRVTYRLTFQSSEKTLAHEVVDLEMTKILELLKSEHNLELAA